MNLLYQGGYTEGKLMARLTDFHRQQYPRLQHAQKSVDPKWRREEV
jgi:hypothetical protein